MSFSRRGINGNEPDEKELKVEKTETMHMPDHLDEINEEELMMESKISKTLSD